MLLMMTAQRLLVWPMAESDLATYPDSVGRSFSSMSHRMVMLISW